jgi:hypothetical protein
MKQYLWGKVVAALIGLGGLLYGISILDADPTLRELQQVSMADIEAGRLPRDGQKVRITDAWLLPTWVVEHSHSRKRGDHAHAYVGLGSQATLEHGVAEQPTDVKLWVLLSEDYRTREAATAALSRESLYGQPSAREGVINALPANVREALAGSNGVWTTQATMRLEEGATPSSAGDGAGFVAAGLAVLALVAAWLAADRGHAAWRQRLTGAGTTAFAGTSPWLLAFGLALLAVPAQLFFVAQAWVDARQLATPLALGAVALAVLAGVALWRNRRAWVVTPQGLERAGHGGRQPLLGWDEVDALSIAQRHFRGNVAVTYTLHAGQRQVKLGNGLFNGGISAHEALGQALREQVQRRVGPALLERLARGERVAFGALGASSSGLIKGRLDGGELLPWSDIDSTTLKAGRLKIKRKGKLLAWENVALGKLHNPDVLLGLIQQRGLASTG